MQPVEVLYYSPESPIPCHQLLADRLWDDAEIKHYVNAGLKLGSHIIHPDSWRKSTTQIGNRGCETLILGLEIPGVNILQRFSKRRALLENILVPQVLLHGYSAPRSNSCTMLLPDHPGQGEVSSIWLTCSAFPNVWCFLDCLYIIIPVPSCVS